MERLAECIKSSDGTPITYEWLRQFIENTKWEEVQYDHLIPKPLKDGDYGRNILSMHPFECVLINWPPGVASAVHHHDGLFGYVYVLEGELDNVLYKEENGQLIEHSITKYVAGGLMPEPDGVIHKITNTNLRQRAVTVHFYYPALETMEGLRIFNLETGQIGVLSVTAATASWSLEDGHFTTVQNNAFRFVPFNEYYRNKSHAISFVYPKPDASIIKRMNALYFDEHADIYDQLDEERESRNAYTGKIDALVAEDLKSRLPKTRKYLDIATGTGRRAVNIRDLCGGDYEIVGVDISEEMIRLAQQRGLRTYHQDWANNDEHTGEIFDAASLLYAFGHIPTKTERIKTLSKVNSYLKIGAPFYFDLFNIENQNEWGPQATKAFEERELANFGYQEGDVFYRRTDGDTVAFVHYYDLDQINDLLTQTGFELADHKCIGYAKNSGEEVSCDQGFYFIKAIKVKEL